MTRRSLTYLQGTLLNAQKMWGPGGSSGIGVQDGRILWGGSVAPPRMARSDEPEIGQLSTGVAGEAVQLSYTPPVDCWWRVWVNVNVRKDDAAYHYIHVYLKLSPADVDGASTVNHLGTQHSQVQQMSHRYPNRIWKLAAGVAYLCEARYNYQGGSWTFYTAYLDAMICGLAYVR